MSVGLSGGTVLALRLSAAFKPGAVESGRLNAPRTSRARGAVRLVYANGREIGAVARARVAKTNFFMGRNPTRQAD
jgi:hypothetical protein